MALNEIDQLILRANGLNGLKNTLMSEGVIYGIKRFRKHFGIDMEATNPAQIKIITEWIKKYDRNFMRHVTNPYEIESKRVHNDLIGEKFVIRLRKDTFMYVSGNVHDDPTSPSQGKLFLYIFGKKCFAYFNELKRFINDNQKSNELIYSITGYGDTNGEHSRWTVTGSPLEPRPMDTIFLDGDTKNKIIDHLDKWERNVDIYKKRGLPFKTGILLYGSPGTGKSSMASAIATYLGCGLITIDTTKFNYINISEVSESINADEDRYVILIDEIDTIFTSRDNEEASDKDKENTSKLLSFLDSQQSPSNVVFVATTNYIDKLDKAVIRKGRFDLIAEFGNISGATAEEMCKSFECTESQCETILSNIDIYNKSDGKINPASLQAAILDTIADKADVDDI